MCGKCGIEVCTDPSAMGLLCMRIQRALHGELGLESEEFKDREGKGGVEVIPFNGTKEA